ncbi:MAG TPA: TRAP transporter fused permease subunit [Desulfobacteraceae bacterium]|nr:TRAP transporter fused permease subunit [Desulfobacteraceae bacterium]
MKRQASRYRALSGFPAVLVRVAAGIAVAASIIQIFNIVIAGQVMDSKRYLALLMALLLPAVFIWLPATRKGLGKSVPWYDFCAAALLCGCAFYVFAYSMDIQTRGWSIRPPVPALWLGVLCWLLVIEAVRRAAGPALAAIVCFTSLYPLIAHTLPGILLAKQYSFARLVGFYYLSNQGMFGVTSHVFGRLVIAFLIFAIILMLLGGGDFFIKLAMSLLGNVRGGAAKVSILGSALFASISGSPTSNVITTGSFTIPAMKKGGYPPYYAGALEACASTGGVLMPPIMGVTAFIMADFLQVSYATVCLSALIPSVLYFFALCMQSDFFAARKGLKGMPRDQCPQIFSTLKEGWPYIVSFVSLIYFLFFLRQEARAPFYSIVLLILLIGVANRKILNPKTILGFLDGSGRVLSEIMTIMVGVGMIIGAFLLTGVAQSFSSSLLETAGGSLPLLLIMGAAASFILGIGMTMIPCYIILALLLAPALIDMGINPLAAHLFILYWGMISFITPPVAIASIVAAGLAETSGMKTGVYSLRLGFVAYILPFFFVYNPCLVGVGPPLAVAWSFSAAVAGIVLVSAGTEGFLYGLGRLNGPWRIYFAAGGIAFLVPSIYVHAASAVAVLLAGALLRMGKKRMPTESEHKRPSR